MSGVQLYDGVIKATEQIIANFGKDILTEERFVNILQDLYPDRDNPAVFRIIKSMIVDGYTINLFNANKENIHNIVINTAASLSKKYGYESHLVENMMYSIAVGSNVVCPSDLSSPSSPKPAPSKSGKPQNVPPQQPTKPTQQPPNKKQNTHFDFKEIGFILLALLSLLLSTVFIFLYLNHVWWLFLTLLANAFVYMFTIIQCASYFGNKGSNKAFGIFCAVVVMIIIINLSALFIDTIHSFVDYYSLYGNGSYTFLSIILDFIICFCLLTVLSLRNAYGKKTNVHNLDFKKGFITTLILLIIVYQFIVFLPFYHGFYMKCRNGIIGHSRKTEVVDFSFQNIKIGDVASEFVKQKFTNMGQDSLFLYTESHSLVVNNRQYSEFVDLVYRIKSEWNNCPVEIFIYSYKDTIHAILIRMEGIYNTPVSLASIYESKYGKPEIWNSVKFCINPNLYDYIWQFKNGLIRINSDNKDYHFYFSGLKSEILYIDNKFEELYEQKISLLHKKELQQKKRKMEKERKAIEEKRIRDSLETIRKSEQMKKEELIRKKAIEQI